MLNFILIGINIFLPIAPIEHANHFNLVFSYNGVGLEYRFYPHLKIGGILQFPQEPLLFEDLKSFVLFSPKNYQIIGYRQIEDTKFYQPDSLIYLNFYPWRQYGFYINVFYQYFSSFSKEISSIPLDIRENAKYIEVQNYYFSNFITFSSYKLYYNSSQESGIGIGYEYWFNKRIFINLLYGYYTTSLNDFPDKIIYFPDKVKWIFYKDQNYSIEDLILQERELKAQIEKNNNNPFRFFIYFMIGIKI